MIRRNTWEACVAARHYQGSTHTFGLRECDGEGDLYYFIVCSEQSNIKCTVAMICLVGEEKTNPHTKTLIQLGLWGDWFLNRVSVAQTYGLFLHSAGGWPMFMPLVMLRCCLVALIESEATDSGEDPECGCGFQPAIAEQTSLL